VSALNEYEVMRQPARRQSLAQLDPMQRRVALLEREAPDLVGRADEVGIPIKYLGIAPLFAEPRAYPGPTTDWVIGPIGAEDEMPIPRQHAKAVQTLKNAGIDFPMTYVAHEIPKEHLALEVGSGHEVLDVERAAEVVGPAPLPASSVTAGERLGNRAETVLRLVRHGIVAVGALAAAPVVLVGAAAAAVATGGLDPIVFGVIPARSAHDGEPAAWYELTRWEW
jgi:hypothetical protein